MALAILTELRALGIDIALTDDGSLSFPLGVLTDSQRQAIRESKAEMVQLLKYQQAANDELAEPTDWRLLAKAYQAHANACPHCTAAGMGYGRRCTIGLALWARYGHGFGEAFTLGGGQFPP